MDNTWKADAKELLRTYGLSFLWRPALELILLFVGWNLVAVPLKLPYLTASGSVGLWLLAKILLPRILNVCNHPTDNPPQA